MSAVYEKLGLRFMYPENWEVVDDDPQGEPRTVTVYSDDGAFWSITSYNRPIDPVDVSTTALTALRDEYPELEAEHCRQTFGPVEATGYDVHFYVQQYVAAARIRVLKRDSQVLMLLCQAEDRQFDELRRVFDAMTISLLQAGEE